MAFSWFSQISSPSPQHRRSGCGRLSRFCASRQSSVSIDSSASRILKSQNRPLRSSHASWSYSWWSSPLATWSAERSPYPTESAFRVAGDLFQSLGTESSSRSTLVTVRPCASLSSSYLFLPSFSSSSFVVASRFPCKSSMRVYLRICHPLRKVLQAYPYLYPYLATQMVIATSYYLIHLLLPRYLRLQSFYYLLTGLSDFATFWLRWRQSHSSRNSSEALW